MTAKHWALVAAVILLGGISLYINRDWFRQPDIQIFHRSSPRPMPARKGASPQEANTLPVIFGFNRNLQLKSIKVVYLEDALTNKYPRPIWHLASDSNSIPTRTFTYGWPIRGMRPAVKGATPDPLKAGTKYRLLIDAGDFNGEHDFVPLPRTR